MKAPRIPHNIVWRFRNRHALAMLAIDQTTELATFGEAEVPVELTFYVEIPRDLTLRGNRPLVHVDSTSPTDETTELLWRLASRGRAEPGGMFGTPIGRTWLRRVRVMEGLPNFAADIAFAGEREHLTRSWGVKKAAERWFRRRPGVYKSVAACSVWIDLDDLQGEAPHAWIVMRDALEECLGRVNDIIRALAITKERFDLRPLHIGDLPPMIPYTISTLDGIEIVGLATGLFIAHPALPDWWAEPMDDQTAAPVFELVGTLMRNPERRAFIELVADASTAFARSEWRSSIISMVTAAEVIISDMTAVASPNLQGKPVPFRSRVVDHLPKILGAAVDLDDEDDPVGRWWIRCYQVRNAAAHDGAWPTFVGSQFALEAMYRLMDHLRCAVATSSERGWADQGFTEALTVSAKHLEALCAPPSGD